MANRKLKQAQISSCLRVNHGFKSSDEGRKVLLYIDSIRMVLEELNTWVSVETGRMLFDITQ